MRHTAILLACMMTVCAYAKASEETPAGLEALRWKYRVILVFAREPHASNALANLQEFATEVENRDIAWFVLGDNALHTNYDVESEEALREQLMERYFTPAPSETAVLLIGKDGTVKSISSDLDLEAVFGQIDQMPMRRGEMRLKPLPKAKKGPLARPSNGYIN